MTVRGRPRPLSYEALRAIITRVNRKLSTNLVLHDFRHTCAIRLASDPTVPITDVQAHLRHKRLSSTEVYLVARPEEVIVNVQAHHAAERSSPAPTGPSRWSYDDSDLDVLLGPRPEV